MKKCLIAILCFCLTGVFAQTIPLPEHPRPDFERTDWVNLNGQWDFEFDSLQVGQSKDWQKGNAKFSKKINVPFPWGSQLSGVKNEADYAWYKKTISVPKSWDKKRTFVTIGASDWETTVWLDGVLLGKHQGGYTPFSFELTQYLKYDTQQNLVIRVDDKRREFTLYGKQGYGNARGLWQTVYLEARGKTYADAIHFSPDIDKNKVKARIYLGEDIEANTDVEVRIKTPGSTITAKGLVKKGNNKTELEIDIPDPKLWTLEDPYLYEAEVTINDDVVKSYFGMRKISVVKLPNTNYPYIALNNQPVYVQLTLDQSYHPEGFYTFPTDEFMKREIQLCKDLGLNGLRTHIKADIPRKLYWADKLGLLVMADLPNSWGEPDEKMQKEAEFTLREMIKRDYNHPAIFSWIVFNETWGLTTQVAQPDGKMKSEYLPKTHNWVASMYYLAKSLDQTRLVEDNSICCGRGHTETDINSWHEYLPGWEWENYLKNMDKNTFDGSTFNFEKNFKQGNQPNINSECGNVWGYEGSTGDVDWSWDYHRMLNTFRKYPKVAGWLYTEHHDVINEWNGYWRFDRTMKFTGLKEIMPGMTDRDFHSDFYLSTGNDISKTVRGGAELEVPLIISVMSGKQVQDNKLVIEYEIEFTDKTGENRAITSGKIPFDYQPWMQKTLESFKFNVPDIAGIGIVKLRLKDLTGKELHHNFMHFIVDSPKNKEKTVILEVKPKDFTEARWSLKNWEVLDGKKVNGAGKGFFEYQIPVTSVVKTGGIKQAYILVEASAKELFEKDKDKEFVVGQDYMRGAKVSPHLNPNSYPMTDETLFPSVVTVSVNGKKVKTVTLEDDPADHRGVLSWHNQLQDKKLREAGSYGYLIKIPVSKGELKKSAGQGYLKLRLETEAQGGIAIYGEDFGRYPVNPSVVIQY